MTYKELTAPTPTDERVSIKYALLQKTLLEAGDLIFKAAQIIEDMKETALNKPGED